VSVTIIDREGELMIGEESGIADRNDADPSSATQFCEYSEEDDSC